MDRVNNIQPLIDLLSDSAEGKYEIKILKAEEVRVQPRTDKTYSIIVKELQKKGTEFHTFKSKQDRSFRVVLKNIHPSMDITEIKAAIDDFGHQVTNIWNIKARQTRKHLPMLFVDLKPNSNNKLIYSVKHLLNCRIAFEAPRPKREIPQCAACQRYGHTKSFCFRQARCVKCAGNHTTTNCQRKGRSEHVKYVLCGGNYPANYKGCVVYKTTESQISFIQTKEDPDL